MIYSREIGPHVIKTILVWCVVGTIFSTSEIGDKFNCNHISVEEAGSRNLGKHPFCVINEVKDKRIKDMLKKIYHVDFTVAVQPRKFDKMPSLSDKVSWEDQKFVRLREKK